MFPRRDSISTVFSNKTDVFYINYSTKTVLIIGKHLKKMYLDFSQNLGWYLEIIVFHFLNCIPRLLKVIFFYFR